MSGKKPAKSPFMVINDFLSPKWCDQISTMVKFNHVDRDAAGFPVKMEKTHDDAESIIVDQLEGLVPDIETRYGLKIKSIEKVKFEGFHEGMKSHCQPPGCENAVYLKRKWVKVKDVDLTAILWLSDYQNETPIDLRYEVFGGKLEFPAPYFNFSLVPQRGSLIIYPAGPHFITSISNVKVGTLLQARINITAQDMYLYDPANFPGTWKDWFSDHIE
ncbi:hypothetical protein RsoM2USA_431 [Ralstonia phage RsoM2USA]|nr:hypothetical protein RsoM2USA_431 [Ralstonia phage RsoM2USA]